MSNSSQLPNITYIVGPTAVGKSNYAIKLAQQDGAEIISADAYQVYRFMDIGTAKVSKKDLSMVKHHLINTHFPDTPYDVTQFLQRTNKLIIGAKKQNKPLIICGGNGLYLRSFIYNYSFPQAASNPIIRQQLQNDLHRQGAGKLWEQLNRIDPVTAKNIHPNNKHHLLRALEIHIITGKKPSTIKQQKPRPRCDTQVIGLTMNRSRVIEQINLRTDNMIKMGLIDEVELLLNKGYCESLPALNCIGYKETINYLKGRSTKEKMIELIKIHTHQFSKRQMTWFKKIENVIWKTQH